MGMYVPRGGALLPAMLGAVFLACLTGNIQRHFNSGGWELEMGTPAQSVELLRGPARKRAQATPDSTLQAAEGRVAALRRANRALRNKLRLLVRACKCVFIWLKG